MKFLSIFFICSLSVFLAEASYAYRYVVQKQVNVNPNIDSLITILKRNRLFSCLSECNRNDECLSLTFIIEPTDDENCFLYNTLILDSNETIKSNYSNIYQKAG
jgi:hypothetical protein